MKCPSTFGGWFVSYVASMPLPICSRMYVRMSFYLYRSYGNVRQFIEFSERFFLQAIAASELYCNVLP